MTLLNNGRGASESDVLALLQMMKRLSTDPQLLAAPLSMETVGDWRKYKAKRCVGGCLLAPGCLR